MHEHLYFYENNFNFTDFILLYFYAIRLFYYFDITFICMSTLPNDLNSSLCVPPDSMSLGVLGVLLLTLQCSARLYECYQVSVFSNTGTMNILQYAMGFEHYTAAFLIQLSVMPVLSSGKVLEMA